MGPLPGVVISLVSGLIRRDPHASHAAPFMPAQMECVKFLVEERGVEINQQDVTKGWTPLMRCARMAHYTTSPYLAVFEYLLTKGADASIMTDFGFPNRETVGCSNLCVLQL